MCAKGHTDFLKQWVAWSLNKTVNNAVQIGLEHIFNKKQNEKP